MSTTIESNIPMPAPRVRRNTGLLGDMRNLEIGGSLLTTDVRITQVGSYYRHLAPQKYTARTVPEGVRVWRIE